VGSEVHVADIAAAAAHGLSVAKRRLLGGWVERCEGLWLLVLIVEGVSFRQHTLMQNAGNEDASMLSPVEEDVLAMLVTAQAGANVIANAT